MNFEVSSMCRDLVWKWRFRTGQCSSVGWKSRVTANMYYKWNYYHARRRQSDVRAQKVLTLKVTGHKEKSSRTRQITYTRICPHFQPRLRRITEGRRSELLYEGGPHEPELPNCCHVLMAGGSELTPRNRTDMNSYMSHVSWRNGNAPHVTRCHFVCTHHLNGFMENSKY
jgi:hypothetical protein